MVTCTWPDHPGNGSTAEECERRVRRLERAGGAGQWLLSVKADHCQAADDLLAPLSAPCAEIKPEDTGKHDQVAYCEAWDQYLCAECRRIRNDAELKTPQRIPAQRQAVPLLVR